MTNTISPAPPCPTRQGKRHKIERILALVAVVLIAITWMLSGIRAETNLLPKIEEALPDANHYERITEDLYIAWADSDEQTQMGYVAIGEADGYGGPLRAAVGVDSNGDVIGVAIVDNKETRSWYDRVMSRGFLDFFPGKSYDEPFQLGVDLDSVTGATSTSRAIAESVLAGSQTVASELGLPVEEPAPPKIQFGIPEITLLALFAVGYIGHQRKFKYKKQARWATMLVGLVVLGFIYNSPLTLSYIVKLILGYWPQWHTNLYWYFLIGGILFVFTVDNKNPYCEWFCPFGAAQECLAVIGVAKVRSPGRYRGVLAWVQRIVTLAAILLGVFFRSPGLSSYEVFGTLFSLVGTMLQFAVLGIVLLTSLFIRRPWCTYLCPLHAIVEFVRIIRQWILEIWKNLRQEPRAKTA